MPSILAQPYPTCEAVMNRSRSFIYDMLRMTGGTNTSQTMLISHSIIRIAIEEVELVSSRTGWASHRGQRDSIAVDSGGRPETQYSGICRA